jgi:hypothetical protein
MFVQRRNPRAEVWYPINIHITSERLQIFFSKFVEWLERNLDKPFALFLPIKGGQLISDPYGFISIDGVTKEDLAKFAPGLCDYVYQVPTDTVTHKPITVEKEWVESLKAEYERQLHEECAFTHGDSVLFKETAYKNLRAIFQHFMDTDQVYSRVLVNTFSAQFMVTVPTRYLEKVDPVTLGSSVMNKLDMFFIENVSFNEEEDDLSDESS